MKPFRRKTITVKIGSIGVGSMEPIRIQSMTTTPTHQVDQTVDQIMQLCDAGCEIVRVTVQGKKEAQACHKIKSLLIQKGYTAPIVADIHFYPPAALEVVEYVDKVRINPGNFLDKRAQFKQVLFESDEAYLKELERIEEGFAPLVIRAKELGKALRIGVNHGSLSDRIMSRFGDNPTGMVESAIEYAQICVKYNFHNFLFSMKSSNPLVMIEAYRLLVKKMDELGWYYPLHLGVTEAGMGEDGRIKSALGIGTLLLDGIGDTIRVSLTEDPWHEIKPASSIISHVNQYKKQPRTDDITILKPDAKRPFSSFFHPQGSVCLKISKEDLKSETFLNDLGIRFDGKSFIKSDKSPDIIFYDSREVDLSNFQDKLSSILMIDLAAAPSRFLNYKNLSHAIPSEVDFAVLNMKSNTRDEIKLMAQRLTEKGIPFIFDASYQTYDEALIGASIDICSFLIEGVGSGALLTVNSSVKERLELMFSLLQACRMRSSKPDYIACPGCGRTLFNLQQVTTEIQERTKHLKGVKIAIMGCIVNGPGEMADADFGYVGSKTGQIDLYVGKTAVEKNIPASLATEKLIELIKKEQMWVDP